MASFLKIRPLEKADIPHVTAWARAENFAPGAGDIAIYRHTDRQGVWVGWLGREPVGCIAGVRYNAEYGFIGLYLVVPEQRGHGYGVQLWEHALEHLADLPCIGIEAAPDRLDDYARWGFEAASPTTRWQRLAGEDDPDLCGALPPGLRLLQGKDIPAMAVQAYDAQREPSPRPHFLADWLQHPAGSVLALVDGDGRCHGFGRIRPCLLRKGEGWRIGPLLADSESLATLLLQGLIQHHDGVVLIDTPGANPAAAPLMESLGFHPISRTVRMYRGAPPAVSLADVYGLACLELG
jgi:ribosomal-protein-alanine N-acetyltransferase